MTHAQLPAEMNCVVCGHRADQALALARLPPVVTACRNGRPFHGDVGRLMPLAEAKHFEQLAGWIDHLKSSGCPFVVVRRAGRLTLYKERRCPTGVFSRP